MTTPASLTIALIALLARVSPALAQCAMCGNSFEPNDAAISAFNTSVLFLMLAPYTVFFVAAGSVVFMYRRGTTASRSPISPMSTTRGLVPTHGPEEVIP